MNITKPMLACDWDEKKVQFPCLMQPKVDGVRGLTITGRMTGRSLKPFGNRYTNEFFTHPVLQGLDGELVCGNITDTDLCRKTTSALSTHEGTPSVHWYLFDLITPATIEFNYHYRLELLSRRIHSIRQQDNLGNGHPIYNCHVIESHICGNQNELDSFEKHCEEWGYEGVILRGIDSKYKNGRTTVREGSLLRIKRFVDAEAIVVSINEGQHNANEATKGLLGQTERSSHQENMVENGLVGSLVCRDCKTGVEITVSAGGMDHATRKLYFENQALILNKTIVYKSFPKGVKDKPRFPTFKGIRDASDIS